MSKPMAVTLPVVLIILDFYPLGRLRLKSAFTSQRKVLIEKTPFLILSLASSIITVIAQKTGGAITSFDVHPLWVRILVSIRALGFYLFKMLWPMGLSPIYPYPSKISFFTPEYAGAVLLLICITAFCIWSWKRHKVFLAAWAYYVVTLLPVLGIIQVGSQAAADRYAYIPSVGPFSLCAMATIWLQNKLDIKWHKTIIKKLFIIFPAILILGFISNLTIKQEAIWKDSISLWNAELNQFPNQYTIYKHRAEAYMKLGNYQQAIEDLKSSITINQQFAPAYYILGMAYEKLGAYLKAIENYNKATELDPGLKFSYHSKNRQTLVFNFFKDCEMEIKLNPGNAIVYINRGTVYAMMKNYQKALEDYSKAIKLAPQISTVYYNRGLIFINVGNYSHSIADFSTAIRLNPQDTEAYYYRGIAYEKLGGDQQAVKDFQTAARMGNGQAQDYLRSKGIGW
jgi:tetratricopeptide (TPR) repeat protein